MTDNPARGATLPDRGRLRTGEFFIAAIAVALLMYGGYRSIGLPPVVIVGGSGLFALAGWSITYRNGPPAPEIVLPPFLLTIAALELHMLEEYRSGFAPAMSRLFDIAWTEPKFLTAFAFVGPAIYALTALGLFRCNRLAGFVAWFIFIGPGIAEFTHFIFPLLRPEIEPSKLASLTAKVSDGELVRDMGNFYLGATGRYYFPGMYTAILPMIPGIYGIVCMFRAARANVAALRARG
jgi:hypothetical protein